VYSLEKFAVLYDPFDYPENYEGNAFFMAYGTNAFEIDRTLEFYNGINADEKELMVLEAGHFELYWKSEYVDPIVEGISTLFQNQIE
jgi:hypothetical protein